MDEVVVDDVVVGVVEVDELVVDVEVVEDVEYVVVGGVDMVGDACWWTWCASLTSLLCPQTAFTYLDLAGPVYDATRPGSMSDGPVRRSPA